MKLSTVTDLSDHSYTATTYAYDGFGRRTLTQTEGHTATRTLYDGTGFEILRQGTADSNGSFINPTEAQNRYSPYYPYNGGGYYGNRYGYADYFYYLFFGGLWGFGAGGHGSIGGREEAPEYLTIENMYPIYANGTVAGTHKEDLIYSPHKHYWNSWTNLWGADTSRYDDYATYKETLYFGTDVLGSVRTHQVTVFLILVALITMCSELHTEGQVHSLTANHLILVTLENHIMQIRSFMITVSVIILQKLQDSQQLIQSETVETGMLMLLMTL